MVDEDRTMDRQSVIFGRRVSQVDQGTRKGACRRAVPYNYRPAGHVGDPDEASEEGTMGDGIRPERYLTRRLHAG